MTLRHMLLAVGGLVVIAAAVYLAIEVRATPAAAQVATRSQPTPVPPASDDPTPAATPKAERGPMGSSRFTRPAAQIAQSVKVPGASSSSAPPSIEGSATEPMGEAKITQVITEAYAAYDRQEFEDAKAIAARALTHDPKNVKALRIMVSTSCIEGSAVDAQRYFDQLPEGKDRADMRTRCGRDYNITFK